MYAANTVSDKLTPEETAELFGRYEKDKSTAVRNEIVMRSMYIVRYAVISTRNMFKGYVDEEDVTNEAVLALMACVDTFDREKNVRFDTYASVKVRGAIIDYIRRGDNVPRSLRKFIRNYDQAYAELFARLDREPTKEELASEMGISPEKMDACAARHAAAQTLSFEEMLIDGVEVAAEQDGGCYDAERNIMLAENRKMLAEAIKSLKEKEQTVVTLYYYEKLKYSEIARVMGLSESRVCQIHSRAMNKMQEFLKEYMNM